MPVADFDLLVRTGGHAVARVGAADVGAEGAAESVRILGAIQEIVIRRSRLSILCAGLVGIPHQGRAVAPAAHELRGDPFDTIGAIWRRSPVVPKLVGGLLEECVEGVLVLLELANDKKRAAASEVAARGRLRPREVRPAAKWIGTERRQ